MTPHPKLQRFRRTDLPTQPWKNGGGVTREVVSLPAERASAGAGEGGGPGGGPMSGPISEAGSDAGSGAGFDFAWRVSIAHIAASGSFSAFVGVDRSITLLEGPGVHLHSADGAIDHRLDAPLAPFAFAGEAAVQADLLGADCHDFNVMTRRSHCRAQVQVLRQAALLPLTKQGLLMAVRGAWQLQGDSAQWLDAGEGLWWPAQARPWQLRPLGQDAALLAVLIETATP